TFFGNINNDVLARGDREEIREEVTSKVLAAKPGGGYIWHSDHSVPPTVSLASYRYAVELAREFGQY
ncbi:MAG: uroporphyrinogen decarboxylase family protein, partial [Armatimonadota bacterium]